MTGMIKGLFWVGKFCKYFFVWLDLSGYFNIEHITLDLFHITGLFNPFWKFLRLGYSAWDFLGVNFGSRDFFGL